MKLLPSARQSSGCAPWPQTQILPLSRPVCMAPTAAVKHPFCPACGKRRVATLRSKLCKACCLERCAIAGARSAGNCKRRSRKERTDARRTGALSSGNAERGATKRKAQRRSSTRRCTKEVLVVKEPWVSMILDGKKTWEIRGSAIAKRGKIHLAASGGGGVLVGQCQLVDAFPVSRSKLAKNITKHCINDLSCVAYERPHAWVLEKPMRYSSPFSYEHPQGAITWVAL